MPTIRQERDAIQILAVRKEQELCERIRTELVIPFCDKRNLSFMSGNGIRMWLFVTKKKETVISSWDREQAIAAKLPDELWDALTTPSVTQITYANLGDWVEDYTPKGKK